MTAYDKVVKNKLGKEAWELLIQHVNEGKITSQHSNEIASLLAENLPGSKIFGAHMNRVRRMVGTMQSLGTYWQTGTVRKCMIWTEKQL